MIKQQYIVLYAKDGRTSLGFVKLSYGGNAAQVAARVARVGGASAVLSLDDGQTRERFDLVAGRSGLLCSGTAQLSGGRTTAAVYDAGGLLALGESEPPRQSWYAVETGLARAASAAQQVDAAGKRSIPKVSKEPAMAEASLPQGADSETYAPENSSMEADTTIRAAPAAPHSANIVLDAGAAVFEPMHIPDERGQTVSDLSGNPTCVGSEVNPPDLSAFEMPPTAELIEDAKGGAFAPSPGSGVAVFEQQSMPEEKGQAVSELSGNPGCIGAEVNPPDLPAFEMPPTAEPIEDAKGGAFAPPPEHTAAGLGPLNPFLEDRPADEDAQVPPLYFEPLFVSSEEAAVQFEPTWDAARPDMSAGKAHSRFGLSPGATRHRDRHPPDMDSAAPPQRDEPIPAPAKSVGAGGQTPPPATADQRPANGEGIFLYVKGAYANLWRWRRVTSGERGFSYLLGEVLIEDKVVAVAVAVPGSYAPSPPAHLQGFSAYRDGHWLLAQDAVTGESIPI